MTLKLSSTRTIFQASSSLTEWSCRRNRHFYVCQCRKTLWIGHMLSRSTWEGHVNRSITWSSLSYLSAAIRKRPSSSCISRFSSRLFNTGSTFLSAFSMPSRIRIRPSVAARTAHCKQTLCNQTRVLKCSIGGSIFQKHYLVNIISDPPHLIYVESSPFSNLAPLFEICLSCVTGQGNVLCFFPRQLLQDRSDSMGQTGQVELEFMI